MATIRVLARTNALTAVSGSNPISGTVAFMVCTWSSIAMYNFLELNFIVATVFKRHSGLYFWSFIVATYGMILISSFTMLKDFQVISASYLFVTTTSIGWVGMVTGQSIVLYSRLHLVLFNRKRLRAVLIMIIVNAIILQIPTTVMVYGANSSHGEPFQVIYKIYEKIQVTIFCLQEFTISALYIYETVKILRVTKSTGYGIGHRILLRHLISVNALVILLDAPILVFEYAGYYLLQTSYKPMAYSVKLKLEFSILNRLVELQTRTGGTADGEGPENERQQQAQSATNN
jgi:hypothetical protein